jgi:hypothetical protein
MSHRRGAFLSFCVLYVLYPFGGLLLAQQETVERTVGVSAGMGVSYIDAPNVVDYLNKFASPAERASDFASAVEFFVAPEKWLSPSAVLRLEYAYLLKSYSLSSSFGLYHFDYSVHMPTLVLDYLFQGDGFYVKAGGGVGYHFGKFSYMFPNSNTEARFTGSGVGVKLELTGNTAFGESLYGLIGGDLRLDFIGALKDSDGNGPVGAVDPVKLHFTSVGIKFGLVYYF